MRLQGRACATRCSHVQRHGTHRPLSGAALGTLSSPREGSVGVFSLGNRLRANEVARQGSV
eukprot:12784996-Alexandrium_andersonii.AAC.1